MGQDGRIVSLGKRRCRRVSWRLGPSDVGQLLDLPLREFATEDGDGGQPRLDRPEHVARPLQQQYLGGFRPQGVVKVVEVVRLSEATEKEHFSRPSQHLSPYRW